MNIFRILRLAALAIALDCCLSGCTGGLRIGLGDIEGPDTVKEGWTAEFTIQVDGGTNLSYLWMVTPPDAGEFKTPERNKSLFKAFDVQEDKPVQIKVVVTTDQLGPVIKTKHITIMSCPGWAVTWPYERLEVADIATDDSGGIYITGYFDGVVDLDLGPAVKELISLEGASCFIAKYDSKTNLIWAFQVDSALGDQGKSIVVDGAGNIYVLISYPLSVDKVRCTIAKYDTTANLLWYQSIGGDAESIAMDSFGDIYLTGSFYGDVDFNPGPGIDEHTAVGYRDVFLCKFNTTGDYQWTRTWGGEDVNLGLAWLIDTGQDLCIDGFGDIYVAGCFCQTGIDFDPGPGTDTHNSIGGYDIFISKFNSHGGFTWAKTFGSDSTHDAVSCITSDGHENIYVAGNCEGKTDYDPGPAVVERPNGGPFVSNFNIDGELQWVDIWASYISRADIKVINSNIYLIGVFEAPVDFDPGQGVDIVEPVGQFNSYLMEFDSYGNYNWVRVWSAEDAWTSKMTIDNYGNIYILGAFKGTIDFDPGPGKDFETSTGQLNYFLLRLNLDGDY